MTFAEYEFHVSNCSSLVEHLSVSRRARRRQLSHKVRTTQFENVNNHYHFSSYVERNLLTR
jgi:hypothetical protein